MQILKLYVFSRIVIFMNRFTDIMADAFVSACMLPNMRLC